MTPENEPLEAWVSWAGMLALPVIALAVSRIKGWRFLTVWGVAITCWFPFAIACLGYRMSHWIDLALWVLIGNFFAYFFAVLFTILNQTDTTS